MSTAPSWRASVPSSYLLKYLRAQDKGVAFFTGHECLRSHSRHTRVGAQTTPHSRTIATCAGSAVPLESSLSALFHAPRPRKKSLVQGLPPLLHGLLKHSSTLADGTETESSTTPKRTQSAASASARRSARASARDQEDDRNRSWRQRLWRRPGRQRAQLEPNDLPEYSSFLDDGVGRAVRPANELKLRCTEFDENGEVVFVDEGFRKTELIAKYGLLPRDLRKIDSSLLPSILVRPSTILINLLHIRVLIKHNRVLVFDAFGTTESYNQRIFMRELGEKLRSQSATSPAFDASHSLPYEFRALEAILISVTNNLESEFETVREPVMRVLRELEEDIDREKLKNLLVYSKKLSSFERKATMIRDAIDEILEADDDLAAMYLSERASGHTREDDDHTEVEMLLESYHKVCDEIVQVSGSITSQIRNTEEVIRAILDANRNQLMLLDLKFSIGTLGLGGGTFVAALYGMNLKNFIEESNWGFWTISGWCTVFGVAVCLFGLKRLRTVQRLSMFGGDGKKGAMGGRSAWETLHQPPLETGLTRKDMRHWRGKDAGWHGGEGEELSTEVGVSANAGQGLEAGDYKQYKQVQQRLRKQEWENKKAQWKKEGGI